LKREFAGPAVDRWGEWLGEEERYLLNCGAVVAPVPLPLVTPLPPGIKRFSTNKAGNTP